MLVLVRHGETVGNRDMIWSGSSETPLTEQGVQQAIEVGRELTDITFDRVYSSPLSRALETCNYILAARPIYVGKPIHIRNEFIERSYGVLEGRDYKTTMAEFPRRKWLEWERDYLIAPPGGESLSQVEERMSGILKAEVFPLMRAGKAVLIVAHTNVIKTIIGLCKGLDEDETCQLTIEHAIPYVINQIAIDSLS